VPHLLSELLPLPYFHIMALAPLDVWLRLLLQPPAVISPRYWPRLAFALLCSFGATLLTLPERALYALWIRLFPPDSKQLPPPLFILGYYRSGTTHLHYMLTCDPRLVTPRWYQVLAPQGFAVSWALLRFVLVPFLPARRFQDAMLFGANAPAEDDFALHNWSLASTLAGRAVVPQAHAFYDRFHDLERLAPEELDRWRTTLLAFVHKITRLGRGRPVLLKTPSHTARVPELLRLFPQARFIHISRRPDAVLRSNVALLRVVRQRYALQRSIVSTDSLVEEFLATEDRYLRDRDLIPSGQLAEVRLEDLLADPAGEVRRIYGELGLAYGEEFEQRLAGYLRSTRDYEPNVHETSADEPRLAELARRLGHDEPPRAGARPRSMPPSGGATPALIGAVALGSVLVWLLGVQFAGHRLDWLIWPTGIALGLTSRTALRRTNHALGRRAAALALLVLAVSAMGSTWILQQDAPLSIEGLLAATGDAFRVEARLFWSFMGVATAYKLASSDWA
jgi:hypothetical protein